MAVKMERDLMKGLDVLLRVRGRDSSHELSVPRTRLSTYGDRAFPVAAVQIWNSLPQHITSAPSLPVFCTRLKTYFFELCYS